VRSGSSSGSGSSVDRGWRAAGASAYPQPGQRIESFELEEAIGVGGMGAVFRARDLRLDRHVALKLLPPEQASDPEVVQRFYQEGRAAAQLDHENIARVYTIGHDALDHYIAFEYIEGTTIRQRVERNGPLPVTEAINYTLQIASALVHAAERGVVHRDIKPSNIIVTPQGRAKLVDMGLARRFERGNDDGLTQSGMTLGTFDYISPEQARDPRDVDVRSDLYSLGCTLFHMLTGRPPFPEGTVLQKLLQHQEEPPPNVSAINPAVPPSLANILLKLMAKDRDRRYQTPEQLVRDLLMVAGSLGLRSLSPEGLVWMSATAPAAWERHLVWAIPALAFVVVMIGLVWWGQDAGSPPLRARPDALPRLTTVQPTAPKAEAGAQRRASPDLLPARTRVAGPRSDESETLAPVPASPREIPVDSSEDLLGALAAAPPRSILVLTDDGPYLIGSGLPEQHVPPQLIDRDLTVKADVGVVPTLRLARDPLVAGKAPSALLDLVGGRVALEGLEFLVDAGEVDDTGLTSLSAIRTEDTELTLRRCRFRRQGPADRTPSIRVSALLVRATLPAAGDRSPAVLADSCHIDGDQVGILAQGPVELQLRDCTLGALPTAFWLGNSKTPAGATAEIRLRHISLIAAAGPIFRFEGPAPRVWIDDSAIAPARDAEATLVAADDPDGLDWRGRGNLYGRIGVYLQPMAAAARTGREAVREFTRWAETAALVRETGSVATPERVWSEDDPEPALAQESLNPARVFRLAAVPAGLADVGVRTRQGPFGALAAAGGKFVGSAGESRRDRETHFVAGSESPPVKTADEPAPMPMAEAAESVAAAAPVPAPTPTTAAEPDPTAPMPLARTTELPVMPPMGRETLAGRTVAPGDSSLRPDETENAVPAPAAVPAPIPAAVPNPGPDGAPVVVLRTVEQLASALSRPGSEGGELRIAADADWVLTGLQVRTLGRWKLRAEPGPSRPRLRFRPAPADPKAPTAWSIAMDLRAGAFHCEGIDLILAGDDAPPQGRWSAFGVGPATELSLSSCTVTIEGDEGLSAAVLAGTAESDNGKDGGASGAEHPNAPAPARVLVTDSLLRCGGDLVEVAAGGQLTLELSNVIVAAAGSLVHTNGLPRGQSVAPLKLGLRQVTARMVGGLIQLESAPGEPELPLAEISARDSILATAAQGAPLVQIDGQDDLSALQNRIRWDGVHVAYHQIGAYRRDQTAQLGTVPKIYNRPDWMVAVGPQEEAPIHGDLKFARKWNTEQPAWLYRRDDFRLASDSPAGSAGADLAKIPPAPSYPW
jgi:serine/threonine-protein kinase